MSINAADITKLVRKTTAKWAQQRKAEERDARAISNRAYMFRSSRVSFSSQAHKILPGAYAHASDNGRLPVTIRQLFYACREKFREATNRQLKYEYFSSTLLVKYMNRHRAATANWRITADPRGTLVIPNASEAVRVPCGTVHIDDHLRMRDAFHGPTAGPPTLPLEWPSLKGGQRYKAVLYIEKEGFEPLLEQQRIAERYEIAVLSCKGQSVVAARKFVDLTCAAKGGVPLLVVHDFDKYGFDISQRLTSVSWEAEEADRVRYRFQNYINVTDLGLRLADIEKYGLADEEAPFKGDWPSDSICTPEEKAFLESGRRVELNAFTSAQFIEWLEGKLKDAGLAERLVPDDDVLDDAYRRAVAVHHMNKTVGKVARKAQQIARKAELPDDLRALVLQRAVEGDKPWDLALHDIIQERYGSS
jgi:hypothetical protein